MEKQFKATHPSGGALRLLTAVASILDPRLYLHAFRILHFYGYSHVREKRRLTMGVQTGMAPNVSLRNANRIRIGHNCHIGERCCLWAGAHGGQIIIGDYVSMAPEVFITASDYRFVAGQPFRQQPRRERDVVIGRDVWLGVRVIVTAGVTIGDGCIVGAGAVVTKDLPGNTIAVGIPARVTAERPAAEELV